MTTKTLFYEIDLVGLQIIAFLIFCTLRLPIWSFVGWVCCGCCALSSGLVGGLCPCQLEGKPTQSVLSCLPQSVNWRVCELSGQRGVKRNPADSNKHHTFQSSRGCKKSCIPWKIVCQADFVKKLVNAECERLEKQRGRRESRQWEKGQWCGCLEKEDS